MKIHFEPTQKSVFERLLAEQKRSRIEFNFDWSGIGEGDLVVHLEVEVNLSSLSTGGPVVELTGRRLVRYASQVIEGHPAVEEGLCLVLMEPAVLDAGAAAKVDVLADDWERKHPVWGGPVSTKEADGVWVGADSGLVN